MVDRSAVHSILTRAVAGDRIADEEALVLMREGELLELGQAANAIRNRLNDPKVVTYIVDRNINYTNICVYRCKFCAFYRKPGDPEGYLLTRDELRQKIQETIDLGGTGVLLQGGVHPDLPLSYYTELLSWMREEFPDVHRHAFSPPEILFIARVTKMPLRDVIARLIEAGLQSIPGGGAEILVDRIRLETLSYPKASSEGWLDVMRTAHELGLRTTATMMFGQGESPEHRIEHLRKVRELQDETGGFTAFIAWTFQNENTEMQQIEEESPFQYLRTQAIARIYLDNIRSIQSSWVTQGLKIGQLALKFGANDMGSIMIEENVVAAAGARNRVTTGEMKDLIREAGYEPVQRLTLYHGYVDDVTHARVYAEDRGAPTR
ncbi:MAG TPA: cyclic dehypoxanthinyl futalosine synthase [Thermoanaerobaculia bacterium]|nr:cyclic dehypoxanthinyl futalosine synthase [Thermoanaerobaculia bacterium]